MAGYGKPDAQRDADDRRGHRQGPDQGREGLRQPLPARVAAEQEGPRRHRVSEPAAPVTSPLSGAVVVDLSTRDRRRVRHQAPRRRRRRRHQGRAPRGRSAAALVGVRGRDPRRHRRRAVRVPGLVEAERGRRSRRRRRTSPACTRCWSGPTRWCGRRARASPTHPSLAPGRHPAATARTSPSPRSPRSGSRARGATGRPPSSRSRPGPAGSSAWAGAPPTGPRCSSAARSASGSPAPRPPSARWCRGPEPARDGPGELVDVSMLETLVLCLTYYPVTYVDMVGRPFRSGRSIVTPGVEATSDGLVGLGVGTGQQWLDFCVMVDHPEWMEDRQLFANRGHLSPRSRPGWPSARRPRSSSSPRAFRIPHAPIGNGATIPVTDHFQARGSIVTNPRGDVLEPDRPYRFDPPAPAGPRPRPPPRPAHRTRTRGRSASFLGRDVHRFGGRTGRSCPSGGCGSSTSPPFWAGPLCTHGLAHARRRGPPPRVHGPARRHPPAGRPALLRARLVGAVRDLRRPEHQQEGRDPRPRHRPGPGAAAPPDRHLRRHRREQHAAGARAARPRRRGRPRHPARPRHGAHARASGSTARGATTRPSPSSSRTPPG